MFDFFPRCSKRSIEIFFFIVFTLTCLCSCTDTSNWTELDWANAQMGVSPERYAVGVKRGQIQRHTENMLDVGMPEEEFLKFVPEKQNQPDSDGSYLLEHKANQYVFMEFPSQNEKARVTFENGRLVKFERYGTGSNPWGYADDTSLLNWKHRER